MLVSSANIMPSRAGTQFNKSLIKTKKGNGPTIDPCGTPIKTSLNDDHNLFISTHCRRFDR